MKRSLKNYTHKHIEPISCLILKWFHWFSFQKNFLSKIGKQEKADPVFNNLSQNIRMFPFRLNWYPNLIFIAVWFQVIRRILLRVFHFFVWSENILILNSLQFSQNLTLFRQATYDHNIVVDVQWNCTKKITKILVDQKKNFLSPFSFQWSLLRRFIACVLPFLL